MIFKCDDENIAKAAAVLRSGGLAAFPTETVYGLGADAFNAEAAARIFEAKGRPRFDPLIVHIACAADAERAADFSRLSSAQRDNVRRLSQRYWPGPLTLVLPRRETVPGIVSSGLPTVAVRFPNHGAAQKLIAQSGTLIAAPSANLFGRLSPTRAEHVEEQLGDRVDMILDGGPCAVGVESTVLDMCGAVPRILRPGGVSREQLQALVGETAAGEDSNDNGEAAAYHSPGQMKSHYAPHTPLYLHDRGCVPPPDAADTAYIFFDKSSAERFAAEHGVLKPGVLKHVFILSQTGNAAEAAARLFDVLHEADGLGVTAIHAERADGAGLGEAINDRLTRAAGRER